MLSRIQFLQLCLTLLSLRVRGDKVNVDLSSYVLPMVGSEGGGNTFPGVSAPYGMVKLGPDLYNGNKDSYSGYQREGVFTGFSMLHESGTGGAPKYGVVSQLPVVGNLSNPLANHTQQRAAADEARVGYYKATLAAGLLVELGATNRAGMYRYTFPTQDNSTLNENNILVDVSHVLPSYRRKALSQRYLRGSIAVEEKEGRLQYRGSGSYDNGWNHAPKWTIYFCGFFDAPGQFRTFIGKDAVGNEIDQYPGPNNITSTTSRVGAVFTFQARTVVSRVGVSFISEEQACQNVESQIPHGTSLETLESKMRSLWNEEILSKVTTSDTANTTALQLLYTSLYHMSLLPTNKTGENPLWESSEPYYDDIFTLWDTHRCLTPLFHIIHPIAYEEFIQAVIDIFRHDGYLPDGRSSHFNGATQGGSNADNVLADAFVKGVRGRVNWDDGYAAMVKDAEIAPPSNNDERDTGSSTKEGRGALQDWLQHGFITTNFNRSVSRAVEYSVNDFALYQVAKGLNREADSQKYLNRSRNWRQHWNPEATALGFKGFVVPRTVEGFLEQNPLSCGDCYWSSHYYQSPPWQYSFNAHHDMTDLIKHMGGAESFLARLDATFKPGLYPDGDARFNKSLFDPSNEPGFTTPYLYNFVNRPDHSVQRVRDIAKTHYRLTPDGLPGESDAGAMESWLLWAMLGLYPLTGQTTFLIGSPWFSNLVIRPGSSGKTLEMNATGGSADAFHVQNLKINGQLWTKSWVSWEDVFERGGTMEFVLGKEPVMWATGPPPPSPASQGIDIKSTL